MRTSRGSAPRPRGPGVLQRSRSLPHGQSAPKKDIELLDDWIVPGPDILGNQADRVPAASFANTPAPSSLALVRPAKMEWLREKDFHDKDRVRVLFGLKGAQHDLRLTDPVWEARLRGLALGIHSRSAGGLHREDEVLLTVSMGGAFHGDCYKFVAAIVVLP